MFWAIEVFSTAIALGVMVLLLDSWGGLPLEWWQWTVVSGVFGAVSNWAGTITRTGRDVVLMQRLAQEPMLMCWRIVYVSVFSALVGAVTVGLVVGTLLWVLLG